MRCNYPTTRLSGLQLILLTHAAGRSDGQFPPLPAFRMRSGTHGPRMRIPAAPRSSVEETKFVVLNSRHPETRSE